MRLNYVKSFYDISMFGTLIISRLFSNSKGFTKECRRSRIDLDEHIGMKHINTRTLGTRSFMYDLVREA